MLYVQNNIFKMDSFELNKIIAAILIFPFLPFSNLKILKHILEKQLAYPAQLEKVDSTIKTINAAIAGASITGIIYRTIIDLLDFKAAGQKINTNQAKAWTKEMCRWQISKFIFVAALH